MKTSGESYQKKKFLTICQTFEKGKIATKLAQTSPIKNPCDWVPAAFFKDLIHHHRIYGGVNMNATLTSGGNGVGMGGNSAPPSGGNMGARHVVWMDSTGRMHATTTAVNVVTQQQHQAATMNKWAPDQFNSSRPPSTQQYWQSATGAGNIHHTTVHPHSYHVHNANGVTSCVNDQGKATTYLPADRSHNCAKN